MSSEISVRPQSPRLTVPVAADVAEMLSSSHRPGSLSAARRSAFSADVHMPMLGRMADDGMSHAKRLDGLAATRHQLPCEVSPCLTQP